MMFEIVAFAMLAQAAPAAAAPAEVNDGDKIVCKSHKYVGTNIRERICKKKSEWDQGSYASKSALERRGMSRDVKGQDGLGGNRPIGGGGYPGAQPGGMPGGS